MKLLTRSLQNRKYEYWLFRVNINSLVVKSKSRILPAIFISSTSQLSFLTPALSPHFSPSSSENCYEASFSVCVLSGATLPAVAWAGRAFPLPNHECYAKMQHLTNKPVIVLEPCENELNGIQSKQMQYVVDAHVRWRLSIPKYPHCNFSAPQVAYSSLFHGSARTFEFWDNSKLR